MSGVVSFALVVAALPSVALAGPPEGSVVEQPTSATATEPAPASVPTSEPAPAPSPVPAQPQTLYDEYGRPYIIDAYGQQVYLDANGQPMYLQPTQPSTPPPQAVPPPTKPRNPNRGLGMMVGGFSAFGVVYVINLGTGLASKSDVGRALVVPVVGPFIATARLRVADTGNSSLNGLATTGVFLLGFLLVVDGLVQIMTLSLGAAGAGVFAKSRANARVSASPGGLTVKF